MRKLILLLLFSVLFLRNNSSAQTYVPFPDSNAIWNYELQSGCQLGYTELYSYCFSNDTLISGYTYHKIIRPFNSNLVGCNNGLPFKIPGYQGCIRQDTISRKVFIVIPYDTTEQLLYDFNMQVGDTLKGYVATYCPLMFSYVDSIDSILIGNGYRKRWLGGFGSIIEGIGSTYDLIDLCALPLNWYQTWLTCFKLGSQTVYPYSNFNCNLITGLSETNIDPNEVAISPNPVENSLTINSSNKINSIKIYSMDLKELINKKTNHSISTVVDVSSLRSGLYIISIENEKGILVFRKIIKM